MNDADLKLIDEQKVDSRARHTNLTIPKTHATLPMEQVYCVQCGAPYGWVTIDSANFIRAENIVVFCDKCEAAFGKPPLVEANVNKI